MQKNLIKTAMFLCTLLIGAATGMISLAQAQEVLPVYSVRINCLPSSATIAQGAWADFGCHIENRGNGVLDPAKQFFLSYHLLNDKGAVLRWDNQRFGLPAPVAPGAHAKVGVRLLSTNFPGQGSYQAQFDVVYEGVAWFGSSSVANLQTLPVVVAPFVAPSVVAMSPTELAHPTLSQLQSSNPNFGLLWWHIAKSLEFTHSQFKIGDKEFSGFVAGGGYPHVWIRDCNTTFHAARWFYGSASLDGCVYAHLARQRADGYVFDWVDARGGADKNTVETDQETSLVQLASAVVRATGDREPYTNRAALSKLLEQLDGALGYVWRDKRDPTTGLVIGAHTIDWGDVEMHDGAKHPVTHTGLNTVWTVDIYDQAMFVLAANALADLYTQLGNPSQAHLWRNRGIEIQGKTRKILWDDARGYFVMHKHITPYSHAFEEDDLFPMGGNTVAIEAGIATAAMARRIVNVVIERQALYGVSTVSGVLLPPYPDNTFKHNAAKEQWHYQNGGQWDWFGARLILQMYRLGMSDLATAKLDEIARKVSANQGIYEWDTRTGQPRGSAYFAGAAGGLARALVEGYFGIDVARKEVNIVSRVTGAHEEISLRQMANYKTVGYKYERDDEKGRVSLTVRLGDLVLNRLAVKIPKGYGEVRRVSVNGRKTQHFQITKLGGDDFISIFRLARASPQRVQIYFLNP